jgi:O-methyltransferase
VKQLARLNRALVFHRFWKYWLRKQMLRHGAFLRFPPYSADKHALVTSTRDPVRYTTVALAIDMLEKAAVPGSFAEVGVYRGDTSRIIHRLAPNRPLYLFDTFEGFPAQDIEVPDERFRETNLEMLREKLGDLKNIIIRKGYFPDTTVGLENERFAFVMLDVDKYKSTAAGLQFFYPRLSGQGFLMVHDYNSPESDYAVARAVDEFMAGKPEQISPVADSGGSIFFRKLRQTA